MTLCLIILTFLAQCVENSGDDTVGDLKKLIAAQTGTNWEKIVLKKWYNAIFISVKSLPLVILHLFTHLDFYWNRYTVYKDHITLEDYEIHDGMNLELYYN